MISEISRKISQVSMSPLGGELVVKGVKVQSRKSAEMLARVRHVEGCEIKSFERFRSGRLLTFVCLGCNSSHFEFRG